MVLMFVTPVFWLPGQLGDGSHKVVTLNYMYHLIEVMRAPMLGTMPAPLSYQVTIAGALLGWVITFEIYARFCRHASQRAAGPRPSGRHHIDFYWHFARYVVLGASP
jgi:ABC-type polysaccharide/polyol phosphate export permease